MNINRTTGLAIGFGIGAIIAVVVLGASWLINNNKSSLKTQSLQKPVSNSDTVTRTPVNETTPTQSPNQDTLLNRMVPKEDEIINDIQNNLQQIYGPTRN